jgi:hypothetical protein
MIRRLDFFDFCGEPQAPGMSGWQRLQNPPDSAVIL